jgi:hypothetical protein
MRRLAHPLQQSTDVPIADFFFTTAISLALQIHGSYLSTKSVRDCSTFVDLHSPVYKGNILWFTVLLPTATSSPRIRHLQLHTDL